MSLESDRADIEQDPLLWACTLFPAYITSPFGPHHITYWQWLWAIRPGVRPAPLVAVLPRGHAKSSTAEMGLVALGARRRRRYGLYISGTQDQADDHVASVASMLESPAVETFYPALASRMVGKYGNSRGWRRNRLRCSDGFTVDAIGLDVAARGIKLEADRPDFLIIDDVDDTLDTQAATAKKIKALTRKLIPAGGPDVAVLAIQNLVHPDSLFSQLVDGRADFLADRQILGPIPAVENLETVREGGRDVIVRGQATWAGMSLQRCQEIIDDVGLTAFLNEHQQDVEPPAGGMFDHLEWQRCDWSDIPDLVRTSVWVDPAVTDTDQSDAMGIQADGLGVDGKLYRLWSWEQRTSPLDAITRALRKAIELGATRLGVETDQGGDTWQSVYREAQRALEAEGHTGPWPVFAWEKAGAGHGPKAHRAGKMLTYYEQGRVVHVRGTHAVLEAALKRFPLTKPLDLVDAAVWCARDLLDVAEPARSNAGLLLEA